MARCAFLLAELRLLAVDGVARTTRPALRRHAPAGLFAEADPDRGVTLALGVLERTGWVRVERFVPGARALVIRVAPDDAPWPAAPPLPELPQRRRRTTCKAGHDLTDPANAYAYVRRSNGRLERSCRVCRAAAGRRRTQKAAAS